MISKFFYSFLLPINTFIHNFSKACRQYKHQQLLPYFHIGQRLTVDEGVKIYNPNDISIGDGCRLQENVWLNVVQTEIREVLTIGNECDIGRNSFITAKDRIVLEDCVLLAPNVFISDHSHRFDNLNVAVMHQESTTPKPVRIGSGTWIGTNCVILPGVTIGKHCVIGANSVVNTSIPDFSVAAGVPAKVIKRLKK